MLRRRAIAYLLRRHPRWFLRLKKLHRHALAQDGEFLRLHAALVEDGEGISTLRERYNLWQIARRTAPLGGSVAEVGVYRGGSAAVLAAAKSGRALHLFDTFGGMPTVDRARDGQFYAGQFADTDLETVRRRLKAWPDVFFHPGFFPLSAESFAPDVRFSLVHVDVDIESSTLAALEFFFPRLVPGGFLVVHDYSDLTVPGTKSAVDAFLRQHACGALELWDTQIALWPR